MQCVHTTCRPLSSTSSSGGQVVTGYGYQQYRTGTPVVPYTGRVTPWQGMERSIVHCIDPLEAVTGPCSERGFSYQSFLKKKSLHTYIQKYQSMDTEIDAEMAPPAPGEEDRPNRPPPPPVSPAAAAAAAVHHVPPPSKRLRTASRDGGGGGGRQKKQQQLAMAPSPSSSSSSGMQGGVARLHSCIVKVRERKARLEKKGFRIRFRRFLHACD